MAINTNLCEVLDLTIETMPEKLGTGSLVTSIADGEPRYCALGWLGHCAGYSNDELAWSPNYEVLFDPLGITPSQRVEIYGTNDGMGRDAVLGVLLDMRSRACA